jgi:hypothetical protein
MENGKNYIENLYSNTFGNYEDNPSNDEWDALNSKLSRLNFLKFSFTTFNVFYLFVILLFASTTAYLGMNNYILISKNKALEIQIIKLNHSNNRNNIPINTATTKQDINDNNNAFTLTSNKAKNNNQGTTKSKQVENNNNGSKINSLQKKEINGNDALESTVIGNEVTKSNSIVAGTVTESGKADSTKVEIVAPQKIKKVRKTVFIKQAQVVVKDTIVIKKKLK